MADAGAPVELTDYYADTLGTIDPRLLTHASVARALRAPANWSTPELLRGHAEALIRTGSARASAEAAKLLRDALDLARRQHAVSWEARIRATIAATGSAAR